MGPQEAKNGRRQGLKVADHPIRTKFSHQHLAVAEIDRNYWDTGGACYKDVGGGVADHDRGIWTPARSCNRAAKDGGIGLGNPERVSAADGCKTVGEPVRIEKPHREPFKLVRADRQ